MYVIDFKTERFETDWSFWFLLTLDRRVGTRLQNTLKHGPCVVLKSVENETTNSRPGNVWNMSRFFSSGKAKKN